MKHPTIEEVKLYGIAIELPPESCEAFFDHWEMNGWETKKAKIKDWKAALRTWKRNAIKFGELNPKAPAERQLPLFQQLKSVEALLIDVRAKLNKIECPHPLRYEDNKAFERAIANYTVKRTPLLAEKKRLEEKLKELHRRAAE